MIKHAKTKEADAASKEALKEPPKKRGADRRNFLKAVVGVAAGAVAAGVPGLAGAEPKGLKGLTLPPIPENSKVNLGTNELGGFWVTSIWPGDELKWGNPRQPIHLPYGTRLLDEKDRVVWTVGKSSDMTLSPGGTDVVVAGDAYNKTQLVVLNGLKAKFPATTPIIDGKPYKQWVPSDFVFTAHVPDGYGTRILGIEAKQPHKIDHNIIDLNKLAEEREARAREAERRREELVESKGLELEKGVKGARDLYIHFFATGEAEARAEAADLFDENFKLSVGTRGAAYVEVLGVSPHLSGQKNCRIAPETSLEIQYEKAPGDWVRAPKPGEPGHDQVKWGYELLNSAKFEVGIPTTEPEYTLDIAGMRDRDLSKWVTTTDRTRRRTRAELNRQWLLMHENEQRRYRRMMRARKAAHPPKTP